MNKRALAIIFFVLLPLAGFSQISIRIFARSKPASVIFTPESGVFLLRDGAAADVRLTGGDAVAVTSFEDRIIYRTLSGIFGAADSVAFTPASPGAVFRLRAPGNAEPEKLLNGKLTVRPFPGSLQMLNFTTVEESLPGVVRAEAGKLGPSDYFRAQAVVARTYFYRNMERHSLDGYNFCDDIHCQVYPGVVKDSVIVNACRSTAGKVLADRDSLL
ncbi:hypothetical protein EG830_13190, partial [bacterium]|nr:hypothetical protein [bacterium]